MSLSADETVWCFERVWNPRYQAYESCHFSTADYAEFDAHVEQHRREREAASVNETKETDQ